MEKKDIKLAIIGIGFVGGAMMRSFIEKGYKLNENLFIYDKYKDGGMGSFESVLNADIIFLSLPTLFDDVKKCYDLTAIDYTCSKLNLCNYTGTVVIKSTVEPETTEKLAFKYKLNLVNNPEFLTASTAYKDFHNQKHIVLGKTSICNDEAYHIVVDFYKTNYPDAEISLCKSTESESMKIFANSFYAVKIQFMNEIYLLCQSLGIEYNVVKGLMLKNGWINPMHTQVPGTDGKLSYGGMCFPKDTNALLKFMESKNVLNGVLDATIKERNMMRPNKKNIDL